jgi:hypothetical protein
LFAGIDTPKDTLAVAVIDPTGQLRVGRAGTERLALSTIRGYYRAARANEARTSRTPLGSCTA